jgi:hypothetical protein
MNEQPTLFEFLNAVPLEEYEMELEEKARKKVETPLYSPPIAGRDVIKHLNKTQIKKLLSDPHYVQHVAGGRHIPVFRVQQWKPGLKKIRVGNTEGQKFVEFHMNDHGSIAKKRVYAKVNGPHPNQWTVAEKWPEDEMAKKAKKK